MKHAVLFVLLTLAVTIVASPIIATPDDVVPEDASLIHSDLEADRFGGTEPINDLSTGKAKHSHTDKTAIAAWNFLKSLPPLKRGIMRKLMIAARREAASKSSPAILKSSDSGSESLLEKESVDSLRAAVEDGKRGKVMALVQAGVHVDTHLDLQGHTALMMAVERDDDKMVETLLQLHARVLLKDKQGHVAFDYCHPPAQKEELLQATARFGIPDLPDWLNPIAWFEEGDDATDNTDEEKKTPKKATPKKETSAPTAAPAPISQTSMYRTEKVVESKMEAQLQHEKAQAVESGKLAKDETAIDQASLKTAKDQVDASQVLDNKEEDKDVNEAVAQGQKAIEAAKLDLQGGVAAAKQDLKEEKFTGSTVPGSKKIEGDITSTLNKDQGKPVKKTESPSTSQRDDANIMKEVKDIRHLFSDKSKNSPSP